ncbi:lachesin-like [Pseudomyrmex gracilis]|uniref:lachesin-like n=1 Tax=Pseudomyrmex gracilis TaxID=219809 RepID=UPI0009954BA2|nr:lachesin-like [Pseudomyrmex gracilis]
MRAISLALTFAFLHTIAAQRSPTISYITQEQVKDIGETVELQCSVQYASVYPVLWIKINKENKQDQITLAINNGIIIADSRFSIRYDSETSTYHLQIKSLQEVDVGYYQCKIQISISSSVSAEVELEIRRPPIISDNSTQSVLVAEDQSIQLECYASGYPSPTISWRRQNNKIFPSGNAIYNGNIVNLPVVTRESRGTYYCIADNGVGRGSKRNINVEVEFSPVIEISRSRVGQALQYDADLECHVEAYPPPAITWYDKNGQELLNSQHYSIAQFADAVDYTHTTLRILSIEKRQYGKYTCRAQNELGVAHGKLELSETIIPVCPPACGEVHYYGTGVVSVSSGPLIALVLLIATILRKFYFKY